MKISKEKLHKEATTTGFRPEILEKVWHLMTILNAINEHFLLSGKLILKGGTALNLFIFDLPRLSVDIDLNYIGQPVRDAMLLERPLIEQALEAIFQREGMGVQRIPQRHAGGKWQLKYESALGGKGNLEVDLNFMFRVPLCPIVKMRSRFVGSRQTGDVLILDAHELGAGKLAALFGRHASRDLFDAHQLLTKHALNLDQLRLISLIYSGMGSNDWRKVSLEEISFEKQELQMQLIPVLNRKFLKAQSDWLAWTNQLLNGCREALCSLFPLKENESEFLDKLHDHGVLEPSLLTTDEDMIGKINSHPLLKWKVQLALQNKSMS